MDAPAGDDAGGTYNSSSSMEAGKVDQAFVKSLRQKLKSKKITILRKEAGSSSCCIHRVPPTIRQHNEKACTPLVVSLGPFHSGNPMLQAMEEHKWRYLDRALSLATDNELERFSREIEGLAQTARDCYSEIINLGNDELVEMMVLDGCFILQIVLIRAKCLTCDQNDLIFRQSWLLHRIKRDMLLLENQIPFFVLELVFNLIKSSVQMSDTLVEIFCKFFKGFGLYKRSFKVDPMHLLHLVQLCVLPGNENPPEDPALVEIPCATRLREAGVRFECVDKNSFLDIMFQNGALKIPPIRIEDSRCPLFLNLIAFEQCYTHYCGLYITSYIAFMNWLIDSADDVLILRRKGIIQNWLGSDEEVADLFNKLSRDVVISDLYFYLSDVVKKINHYRCIRWRPWKASLVQKYFYNPWAIVSLIGVIFLLLLTAIQTSFAVVSYVKPRS